MKVGMFSGLKAAAFAASKPVPAPAPAPVVPSFYVPFSSEFCPARCFYSEFGG